MNKMIKNGICVFTLWICASLAAQVPQIGNVIVRQQWPWSTKIKIEYQLSGVTGPVRIGCSFYDGGTVLTPMRPKETVYGDLYAAKSGVGTIFVEPEAAFGTERKVLADFRVELTVEEVVGNVGDIEEVIYKIFDLDNGSCTDVTRGDILGGKYGSYETCFSGFGEGFNTSVPDVLVWTGVTNDIRYATDKLVMRKIPAAGSTWSMGSPYNEEGRSYYGKFIPEQKLESDGFNNGFGNEVDAGTETQHQVTMKKDYYIGVFEITQAQYEKIVSGHEGEDGNTYITNAWPGYFTNGNFRALLPVEMVSYAHIRGTMNDGANWPKDGYSVLPWSFIGLLRDRLENAGDIDLPTEAQWEFACRAGTSGGLNSGLEIVNGSYEGDVNLDLLGRSKRTGGGGGYVNGVTAPSRNAGAGEGGTARVGSFVPNAYGLYDMHGNVAEWCLDFFENFTSDAVVEPKGPQRNNENWKRVVKGGFWGKYARYCRSGFRCGPTYGVCDPQVGFRLCMTINE